MTTTSPLPRPAWLRTKVSAAILISLLQRTPALRIIQGAGTIIAASPIGTLLKSAVASFATLGAMHSLAGATTFVSSSPSPAAITAGTAMTPIAFTVTDTISIGSWRITGSIPPGLKITATEGGSELTGPGTLDATTGGGAVDPNDPYASGGGGNLMTTPILSGTPTQAGSYTITFQAYEMGGLAGLTAGPYNYVVNVAAGAQTGTAPAFTTQPAPQTVNAGATVTFSAAASGSPAPTYQWSKNGSPISGATSATLTLNNVQSSDAGSYSVTATNASGNVTSSTVALAVNAPSGGGGGTTAPAVARQPQSQVVATGSTVVFNSEISGGNLTYQWRRGGNAITGATSSTLVVNAAGAADAGAYTVVATNTAGSATSSTATLEVVNETNFGHLVNLSIRVPLTASEPSFTVGTVVGGAGTSGPKPLLVRAVGPSLAAFGLTGAIADSRLDVSAGSTSFATNDNWNGDATLSAVFTQVGAFPFASATSRDAAIFNPNFTSRDYTVQVSGVGNATGEVLAELYDATAAGAFGPTTPRLVNVSVSKQIGVGASLTAGFVIGGNTARTVLVRAIGPGLAAFGVGGTIPDPQLTLFRGETEVAKNDNWGGDAQLTAAGTSVGAFAIANGASKDAVLLLTLAPGGYTAQVSGVPGTGGGSTLVEIYEVP